MFAITRAHRALVVRPRPGAPPPAIIAQILKDRDAILRAAREIDRAHFENHEISIYPDYTNKVQNSRKGFLQFKAKLRSIGLRYMLLYLPRLRVIAGGKSHFFNTLEDVWLWLEIWDKVPRDWETPVSPVPVDQWGHMGPTGYN
ncbi:hypothetical protein NDU88_003295 [Pleurodeles waltl]|uniref:Uncharacterized protein n=1 Tax=Pleurodeles waltl TaxID=8319 RepID=A0AAV7Q8K0_PLEWA|nr:hypothetical protein NDU88_003295 [Pleurodeles waltl]